MKFIISGSELSAIVAAHYAASGVFSSNALFDVHTDGDVTISVRSEVTHQPSVGRKTTPTKAPARHTTAPVVNQIAEEVPTPQAEPEQVTAPWSGEDNNQEEAEESSIVEEPTPAIAPQKRNLFANLRK